MSVACMQCFFRAISETGFLEPVCYKFPSLGCMIYVGRNVCSHYDMLYSSMFGALFHYLSIRFISNTIPWKYWPLCTHRRASTLSHCWLCFTGCPTLISEPCCLVYRTRWDFMWAWCQRLATSLQINWDLPCFYWHNPQNHCYLPPWLYPPPPPPTP